MIQSLCLSQLRHHCLWDLFYGEFMSSHFVSAHSIHKRLRVGCIYTLCYFIKAWFMAGHVSAKNLHHCPQFFFLLVSKIKQLSLRNCAQSSLTWTNHHSHHTIRNGFPSNWISVLLSSYPSAVIRFAQGVHILYEFSMELLSDVNCNLKCQIVKCVFVDCVF